MKVLHTSGVDGLGGCFTRHYVYGRDKFGREHRVYWLGHTDSSDEKKRRELGQAIESLCREIVYANETTEEIVIGEPESFRAIIA